MELTLGMAVFDDYPGVEFTVQALRLYHDLTGCEIVVVDNNPKSEQGQRTQEFCGKTGARYVAYTERRGTSGPRDHVFKVAKGRRVAVMDPHIMIGPGGVDRLKKIDLNRRAIYSGPMLDYGLGVYATHFADVWRDQMWGIWAQAWQCGCGGVKFDAAEHQTASGSVEVGFHELAMGWKQRTGCDKCGKPLPVGLQWPGHEAELRRLGYVQLGLSSEPFEIPGMGLGLFACPRDHWLGFHPLQTDFGGEELYIHEKFRQAGGVALCDPKIPWWHRFGRACHAETPPYPIPVWSKIRNYVLEFQELQRPLAEVKRHFIGLRKITEKDFDWLAESPKDRVRSPGTLVQNTNGPQTADELYQWVLANPRDLHEHFPKLRELASKCEYVTAFSKRKEMIAPLLAGRPKVVVNHCTEHVEGWVQSCRAIVSNWAEKKKVELLISGAADSLSLPTIEPTDMLILAQVHNRARIEAELDRFAGRVRKWIVVQGTFNFAERGEDGTEGLLVGVRAWMKKHPEWHRVYQADNQYGLTVLSKDPAERTIDRGPGWELHLIFEDQLKIHMTETCSCRRMMNQMNAWGPQGCRDNFEQIVKHLRDHQDEFGWTSKLRAAVGMVWSGLWLKVNWSDPFPDLVTISIDLAEKKDREWEATYGTA